MIYPNKQWDLYSIRLAQSALMSLVHPPSIYVPLPGIFRGQTAPGLFHPAMYKSYFPSLQPSFSYLPLSVLCKQLIPGSPSHLKVCCYQLRLPVSASISQICASVSSCFRCTMNEGSLGLWSSAFLHVHRHLPPPSSGAKKSATYRRRQGPLETEWR